MPSETSILSKNNIYNIVTNIVVVVVVEAVVVVVAAVVVVVVVVVVSFDLFEFCVALNLLLPFADFLFLCFFGRCECWLT